MLRILLPATAFAAFALASDVDLHNFDDSDDTLSLLQLRATSAHADSGAIPSESQLDKMFAYDIPEGWRMGFGTGNRTFPPWSFNGQPNVRLTHKYLDYKVRSMDACVAAVQAADSICPDANGVTWGMEFWKTAASGERYMMGGQCLCDFCWNPIPQAWIADRKTVSETWVEGYSTGDAGWITAGPGTLDPSKYSEKRKAAIIARQEFCGHMEGYDPLFGIVTTTTTTTPPPLEEEDTAAAAGDPISPPSEDEDTAAAVGDPHLTDVHGRKGDLCCDHGVCRKCQ